MYRAPLPDAVNSLGAMGGTQGTYGTGPKPAGEQTQNNSATQMNTIFASMDGDKSSNVTKAEAQPQISQGFNINLGSLKNERAQELFTQHFNTNDLGTFAKNLYNEFATGFKTINSGKIEVAEGESSQAQQKLDANTNAQINEQIKNINDMLQSKYNQMLNSVNEESEKEMQLLANNDGSNLQMNDGVLINTQPAKVNEFADRGEFTRHGSNISYTTDNGLKITGGSKGASVQTGDFKMGINKNMSTANLGFNNGKLSVNLQQNFKNGDGSINISYKFGAQKKSG